MKRSEHDESIDQRLQSLRRPQPPAGLADALQAQLKRQIGANRPWRRRLGVASMLAVLLLGVWLTWFVATPADVTAAYADTVRDRDVKGVWTGHTALWWRQAQPVLPVGVHVELAKDCWLGQRLSKHVRLRSAKLGTVNLFFYDDGAGQGPWPTKAGGEVADRAWVLWRVVPGMAVLVLHEPQASRDAVAALVTGLFAKQPPTA